MKTDMVAVNIQDEPFLFLIRKTCVVTCLYETRRCQFQFGISYIAVLYPVTAVRGKLEKNNGCSALDNIGAMTNKPPHLLVYHHIYHCPV